MRKKTSFLANSMQFINAVGSRRSSSNASLWSENHQDSALTSKMASHLRLFALLEPLPNIVELAESIDSVPMPIAQSSEEYPTLWTSFLFECHKFELHLTEWYHHLEVQYKEEQKQHQATDSQPRLYWPGISTLYLQLPPDSPARIFPVFICFADPDRAQQIVLYWTALLLMHSTLHVTRSRLLRSGTSLLPLVPEFASPHSPHALALLIAQSLEYFVHPDMGLLGTNFIGFPLAVAQGYFQHVGGREGLWFDVIFERMSHMRTGLGGFLHEMSKGDTVTLVRV